MVSWAVLAGVLQQAEGSDPSPLFSTGGAQLEYGVLFWASQYKTEIDLLESPTKGHRDGEGTGISLL